ncbi:MAG: cytochrome P450 [Planctomycetota bacterium]
MAETIPLREVPCPKGSFTGDMQRDPLGLYERLQREHGDVVAIKLLGGLLRMVVVASPEGVEQILSRNHANYVKPGFFLSIVRPVFGAGVFTSEGEVWKRKRKLLAPAFHPERLTGMAPAIVAAASEHAEGWARTPRDAPRNLLEELTELTLRVASRVFFGADLEQHAGAFGEALREAFACLGARLAGGVQPPLWVPTRGNRRLRRARNTLRRLMREVLAARRADGAPRDDLLGRLLQPGDEGLGDDELVDEMVTLLIAGHDTSAAALAWTLYLLATNPAARDEVQAEVDAVARDRPPTAADLPALRLTRQAFEEALRLYPPAWGQPRQSLAEDAVGGFRLPARSLITTSQWLVQRHPAHWPDPLRFDPHRFDPEQVATRHRFAYVPFGGGPRLCIGRQLALLEAPLILATLLGRFDFAHVGDAPVPDPTFTLRPRDPLRMTVTPRSA